MFQATFRVMQHTSGLEQPGTSMESHRCLVALKPQPTEADVKTWDGTPDGIIQLGKLPAIAAAEFHIGKAYRVTIEPI